MKITEITITDERGEQHTLRCSKGLEVVFMETGAIYAATVPEVHENLVLAVAAGRWISYRTVRKL